jgi:hypothetical protein
MSASEMTPTRARRATTKVVNYAKEQEFSDAEDLFEDEPEEVVVPERSRRGRPPKKSSGSGKRTTTTAVVEMVHPSSTATAVDAAEEDHHMYTHQRPIYTEKGYDPSLPPIRDRFPFLPEYEEDGSPKIELIVGRRPVDEKEAGDEEKDVDSDNEDSDIPDSEDEEVTGRGRAKRKGVAPTPTKKGRGKRGATPDDDDDSPKKKKGATPEAANAVIEYEYLVKYKGRSYLHLEWKTGADLESMNKSAKGIYRRYLKKLAVQGADQDELESPEFDPSYVVPEKIVDEADQEIAIELSDKELLKWEEQRAKENENVEGDEEEEGDNDEEKNESAAADVPAQPEPNGGEEKKGTCVFTIPLLCNASRAANLSYSHCPLPFYCSRFCWRRRDPGRLAGRLGL